jgi:Trypsin-like peptidase domain
MPRTIPDQSRGVPQVAALVLCLLMTNNARANPEIYQRTLRSTGWVLIPTDETHSALGTCWLVDRQRRLAITCQHVVGDSREVLVYFPHSNKGEVVSEAVYYLRNVPAVLGQVIATDEARDLALIRLRNVPEGVQALSLAPRSACPGEVVHSIGNPDLGEGLEDGTLWWYTRGNVRQVYREKVEGPKGERLVRRVETQSPVNQGDSGGPVVNDRCEVIGVTRGYRADRRLISENTDVLEVKDFLATSGTKEDPKENQQTLTGNWQFVAHLSEGKKFDGRAEFRGDGTFVLAPFDGKRPNREGRYAYANGILWLIGAKDHAIIRLAWENKDRFAFRGTKPGLVFDRCQKVCKDSQEALGKR